MGFSLKWRLTYSGLRTSIRIALKWISLSSLIGFLVGLGIIAFRMSLSILIEFFNSLKLSVFIYLLPTVGIVVSIFLVQKFAVKKRGHGANSFIESYHTHWGRTRSIDTLIKTIASIVTLSSGASAGPEGPSIEVGGGIASTLSDSLNLSLGDKRLLSLCGVAAAIGAVFQAPISGCIFSCELIYRDDIEYHALFPSFISSLVGYVTYATTIKERVIPTIIPVYSFALGDMLFFVVLGILIGVIGLIFVQILYGIERLFTQLNISSYFKGLIGGLSVGGLAFFVVYFIGPYMEGSILGIGYDVIGFLVNHPYVVIGNLWVTLLILILLLLGKIVATAITLGSGGVGGTVAPSFFIGAVLGAIIGILLGFNPNVMVVVSSIAFFAAVAHLPITGAMLAAEIYGFDFVIPTGLATLIGHFIARGDSLYRDQRADKKEKVKVLPKYRHIP